MYDELIPTDAEVKRWMLSALKHSCHVEYFLEKLNYNKFDVQRPHDLVGPGNKYFWGVVKCFALQDREPKPDFQTYIKPGLELHRKQHHHRMWNEPDPRNILLPNSSASEYDMEFGAIDAICSLLENREYQGGAHDYDSVIAVAKTNPPHRMPWMLEMMPHMEELEQPDLELITSLDDFPNIGLTDRKYDVIVRRTNDAVERLREIRPEYTLRF